MPLKKHAGRKQAGFDSGQRVVWLLEGLLFYLPAEVVTALFEQITALSVPGSWLGCELKNTAMLTSTQTRSWIDLLKEQGLAARYVVNPCRMVDQCHRGT